MRELFEILAEGNSWAILILTIGAIAQVCWVAGLAVGLKTQSRKLSLAFSFSCLSLALAVLVLAWVRSRDPQGLAGVEVRYAWLGLIFASLPFIFGVILLLLGLHWTKSNTDSAGKRQPLADTGRLLNSNTDGLDEI